MNQRNPFMLKHQKFEESVSHFSTDAHNFLPPVDLPSEVQQEVYKNVQENTLRLELALERKRYAELEIALINQKINSLQVLMQNFEIKMQQLKKDTATLTTDAAGKKKELDNLMKEYEEMKKGLSH